ncbi:MAG: hypothetical protein A3G81_23740 [Betaproteobacteria bacterium RIFCSPLOWO2_12_FULL_65_14]|nr:MAG: hypothetical protein A3G81_23740 [Betaproteobacteria bacterium RIFCSPLOWO2_12_FULL_65_14]
MAKLTRPIAPKSEETTTATGVERVAELVRFLRDRISTHALPPHAPLREEALAQEFRTSRAYVREALSSLEERGLVERIPNLGARVAKFDIDAVIHTYQVREVLEGLCVRLATLNSKPSDWKALQGRFERARKIVEEQGSVEEYLAAIDEFRRRTMGLAGNPVLQDFQETMLDRTRMIIRRIAILPGRPAQGLAEHAAIVAAMIAGDADRAEILARANIRSAQQFVLRYKEFLL